MLCVVASMKSVAMSCCRVPWCRVPRCVVLLLLRQHLLLLLAQLLVQHMLHFSQLLALLCS